MLRPALTLVVLGMVVASPALAQQRLAVVDVTTPPTMIGLGSQVAQTVLKAAQEQGYVVTTPEQLREQLTDPRYNELVACAGKPSCVARKLGGLKLDRVVAGSLNRDDRNYLVRLQLIDLEKGDVIAEIDRSILIASRRLSQDITAAVPRMLRGEREARGTLKLSANVKNVSVTIDGEFAGQTPLSTPLKPGKHEVKLEKKNYLGVTRLVTVEPGAVTQEDVRLILLPGQQAEPDEPPPPASTTGSRDGGGLRVPAAAWACLGAGAVAGGVGVVLGLSARRTEEGLKEGYDTAREVYAGTRRSALSGQQSALVANILYGVAGAAGVTAVVLTIVASQEDEPTVKAAALVTPSGGGLVVRGGF